MNILATAGLLLGLLGFQLAQGPFGIFGWDWSLCGMLVLCLRMRSPAHQLTALGLGLARDAFSVAPLGAQALGLGLTVMAVRFLGDLVLLESFWIQGIAFFAGYLWYQTVFFIIGKVFGFLQGGFLAVFVAAIPKAAGGAVFCGLLTMFLSRFFRQPSEF